MTGWNDSDRAQRLPSNWWSLVKQVKERDGGKCTWRLPSGKRCPRDGTDVDHRVNDDNHDLRNLQLLCQAHHQRKTQREAWAGKAAKRKKPPPKKRQERDPGSLA